MLFVEDIELAEPESPAALLMNQLHLFTNYMLVAKAFAFERAEAAAVAVAVSAARGIPSCG